MPPPTSSRVAPAAHGVGSSARRSADGNQEDGGKAADWDGSRQGGSADEQAKVQQMCLMFPNVDPTSVARVLTSVGFDDNEAVLTLSSMSAEPASRRYLSCLVSSRWLPALVLYVYSTCAMFAARALWQRRARALAHACCPPGPFRVHSARRAHVQWAPSDASFLQGGLRLGEEAPPR